MHVPADQELDPLLLDSSLSRSGSLDDISYSKSRGKKFDTNKTRGKHKKQGSSESSLSDSDLSDDSDCICKNKSPR